MKKELILTTVIAMLAITFVSCKKNITTAPQPITLTVKEVYISGAKYEQNTANACYWKDGVYKQLTYQGRPAYAYEVFVSGNDVYTCLDEEKLGDPSTNIPQIWKNQSTIYNLTTGVVRGSVRSVTVSGADIYACGDEANPSNTNIRNAKVWKNGVATILGSSTNFSTARQIQVNGNDVYVLGSEYVGGTNTGKVWKNGIATDLTNGAGAPSIIKIVGNDIYALLNSGGNVLIFKNGLLFSSTSNINPTCFDIFNSDVYIGGSSLIANTSVPLIFKNGVSLPITVPSGSSSIIRDISFDGVDLHACGGYTTTNGVLHGVYWKNGIPDVTTYSNSILYSIFVK